MVQAADGLHEGVVDLQLGGSGQESLAPGLMSLGAQDRGFLRASHLVGGFEGPAPVQVGHQTRRVEFQLRPGGPDQFVADVGPAHGLAHGLPDRVHCGGLHQVEVIQPEGVSQGELLVPKILWGVTDQLGLPARLELQDVVGALQGAVVAEVGGGVEGGFLVIGEVGERLTAGDDQRIEVRG